MSAAVMHPASAAAATHRAHDDAGRFRLPDLSDRRAPPVPMFFIASLGLSAAVDHRTPTLPWSAAAADERGFARIRQRVLAAALLLGLALPFLPQPAPVAAPPAAALPMPTARLLLPTPLPNPLPTPLPAPLPAPLPSPPVVAAAPVRPAEPAPVPPAPPSPAAALRAEVPQRTPATAAAPARNPVAGQPPGEALAAARRTASGVGLLAVKDELAQLSGAPMAAQFRQDIKPGAGVGTGAGVGVGAGTETGLPARALITAATGAGRGSGGINTAAYSRDTGGGGLAGRATTLVEGVAGGGGGGGPGGGGTARSGQGTATGAGMGGSVQRGASGKASRSIEDIKLVFERHKGAIYAIYNRALRDDPALQGKVVLELSINPAGAVTALRLVSSELQAPELEARLLARIRQFDFGARDVDTMVVSWPVDFLPG